MILVTGGCRSGKSEYAEALVKAMGSHYLYIATAVITDEEMAVRVQKHQQRRSRAWDTLEGHRSLSQALAIRKNNGYAGMLLDSVTTLVTNLLFDYIGEVDWEKFRFESVDFEKAQAFIMEEIIGLSDIGKDLPMVLVTDEIGLGVVPETCLGRAFRDILGVVNQYLAGISDEVYMIISGIPLQIKGKDGGSRG